MPIQYDKVVTQSLARQIAEGIRQAIVRGELAVDERLPTESELAERYGVSRPTVREALKRLAAQNLVRSRRGPAGGTFVSQPSLQELQEQLTNASTLLVSLDEFDLQEIAETRRELELLCARLAVRHHSPEQLQRMAEELALQQSSISDEEFCASDVRFHRALVDASGNRLLRFLMYAVIEALQPVGNKLIFRFRDRAEVAAYHTRILAGLKARNEQMVLAAVEEQMDCLLRQYRKAQASRESS